MSIFVDTGVFYAMLDRNDANHMDAVAIMIHALEGKFGQVITTDYVVLETTLLLKARIGSKTVEDFLRFLERSGIATVVVDEETYRRTVELMKKHPEKLSLCDAATLVIMKDWKVKNLATFDLRSFGNLAVAIVGKGYFNSLSEKEKRRISSLIERWSVQKDI
ncbi:MAG: type II toxin-antitoxin system VapC family toxin [Candidatus Baldrarchaeia archaeon]